MRTLMLIILAVGSLSVAEAACGGGGYKHPTPQPTEVTTTAPSASVAAATPTQPPVITERTLPTANDRADVIEVVSRTVSADAKPTDDFASLHLTTAQQQRADKISQEVRAKHAQLQQDVARAQQQADNCHGDCGAEFARLKTLTAQLQSFSLPREIKTRVYDALGICEVPPHRTPPGQSVATQ